MLVFNESSAQTAKKHIESQIVCFGAFDMTNTVCKKHCAVCIMCIIEKNRNDRIDLMETFFTGESSEPMGLN